MPNVKALVVDDLPTNLQVVRGLLMPYGLAVDTAASGREAIDMAKAGDYDIVLMDHMMPEMDGVEALAVIRKIEGYSNIPVIALTANALVGMMEFYLEHGFEGYLSKPIDPQELDEVLKRWVDLKEKSEEKKEERTGNKRQGMSDNSSFFNLNFSLELESQRLDMLRHYRASFENVREEDYQSKFDSAYFARFTALVESLALTDGLEKQAALLAEAGRRGDARTIRETIPAFCDTLRKQQEEGQNAGIGDLQEILPRLKTALLAGETEPVEAIIKEMGKVKLPSAGRELYIRLYELLLTGETEEALKLIDLQLFDLKLFNGEQHD